jgi:hypothetical protein
MAPRPRWWHQLQASKQEITLAVDIYNRSGQERHLEAFIVHLVIGWTKLLQAQYGRDGWICSSAMGVGADSTAGTENG